jgi:hypothetical protein
VCQAFEYLAHQNATHLGLKFNKMAMEVPSLYSEEFVMSKRQEFFHAYIIKNLKRHKMLPVLQNIIYHICVVLSVDEKEKFIEQYLLHHKNKTSATEFLDIARLYFWQMTDNIEDVVFTEEVHSDAIVSSVNYYVLIDNFI